MSKSNALFDELFPKTGSKFDTGFMSAREWHDSRDDGTRELRWHIQITADDLMRYITSWRERTDAFLSRRIYHSLQLIREDYAKMAGRKRKDAIPDDSRAAWKGFLDRRLTDGELEELDNWKPKPADIFAAVDDMIQNGYRFTLSYNKQTKLASCTIIDDNNTRASGGYALSNADTDGAMALKMAVYKHVTLLSKDWSQLLDQPVRSRRG